MAQFSIKGAKALEQILSQMPDKVAQRVVETALRAGARVIRDEAKRLVPVASGELRDSIMISVAKTEGGSRRRDKGVVFLGFERPTSSRAHLTEFGTAHSAAQPFMRPALDVRGQEAIEAIGKALGAGVEREAAKLAGRHRTKK